MGSGQADSRDWTSEAGTLMRGSAAARGRGTRRADKASSAAASDGIRLGATPLPRNNLTMITVQGRHRSSHTPTTHRMNAITEYPFAVALRDRSAHYKSGRRVSRGGPSQIKMCTRSWDIGRVVGSIVPGLHDRWTVTGTPRTIRRTISRPGAVLDRQAEVLAPESRRGLRG